MTSRKKTLAGVMLLTAALLSGGCLGDKQANIGYFNAERIDQEATQIKADEDLSSEEMARAQQEQMAKMQAASQQYQMQIRQKVDVALDEIAKEKKLDAILQNSSLEKTVVLGGTDITDDLIQKLK